MVVLWWFYGGANARSALTLSYHLCLIDTTYVMLWCPNYYCHHCRVLCCVLYPCCVGVFGICLLLCKEEGSSPVSLKLVRGEIWASMRCPCLCLCWVLGWGLC